MDLGNNPQPMEDDFLRAIENAEKVLADYKAATFKDVMQIVDDLEEGNFVVDQLSNIDRAEFRKLADDAGVVGILEKY